MPAPAPREEGDASTWTLRCDSRHAGGGRGGARRGSRDSSPQPRGFCSLLLASQCPGAEGTCIQRGWDPGAGTQGPGQRSQTVGRGRGRHIVFKNKPKHSISCHLFTNWESWLLLEIPDVEKIRLPWTASLPLPLPAQHQPASLPSCYLPGVRGALAQDPLPLV